MQIGPVTDINQAIKLEHACYPESEAASLDTMQYRFRIAPHLFLGMYDGNKLVGLIMATATNSSKITAASMKIHDPLGKCLCIHSVCVDSDHRRKGYATWLLTEYLKLNHGYEKACLIVHEYLLKMYQNVGFKVVGVSDIVHGPEKWIEMEYRFDDLSNS